jgi:hypothetical protein
MNAFIFSRRDFLSTVGLGSLSLFLSGPGNMKPGAMKFIYNNPPLIMGPTRIRDALGIIEISDIDDPDPKHPLRLKTCTPLTERLWRVALRDIESNMVKTGYGEYFGAGNRFGSIVYTRDISYSGILGVNRLYPQHMRKTLEVTRKVRLGLGLKVAKGYAIKDIDADWQEANIPEELFLIKYKTNSYTRRTDDVVWLWCAGDLYRASGSLNDWRWIYETGKECFEKLYNPFYDPRDGLYRGQASFIDIHHVWIKATGYPRGFSLSDCVMLKATSTNCLYVKGLEVMAEATERLGLKEESRDWASRAKALKEAIKAELMKSDGTFAYYKDRNGDLEERREVLGTALAVLTEVVKGGEAFAALKDYPVTYAGVPLFHPFFPLNNYYHNNSSWPFADTFFIRALEKSDGHERTALNAALLARTCRYDGSFHEVVDFRNKKIRGSGSQLWTASAFVDVCRRAGLVEFD